MTHVHTTRSATTNALKYQPNKCKATQAQHNTMSPSILHHTNTADNHATPRNYLLFIVQNDLAITISSSLQMIVELLSTPLTMTLSSWLMNWHLRKPILPHKFLKKISLMLKMNRIMREHGLRQPPLKLPSWLLFIPKHPFTSVKIAEYFVRENGSNSSNSTNTTSSSS